MASSNSPIIAFATIDACEAWFAEHHGENSGFWLKISKLGAPERTVNYAEALEVALCHGWIDGQKRSLDDHYWLQRFTPRLARSRWSQVNREKAEALAKAGRMRPAGLAEIDRAQADGRWDAAYAPPSTAEVPPDLAGALAADPEAAAFFENLTRVNRYAILYRVQEAKKPQTRAARIEKFVAMCRAGETIYPQR